MNNEENNVDLAFHCWQDGAPPIWQQSKVKPFQFHCFFWIILSVCPFGAWKRQITEHLRVGLYCPIKNRFFLSFCVVDKFFSFCTCPGVCSCRPFDDPGHSARERLGVGWHSLGGWGTVPLSSLWQHAPSATPVDGHALSVHVHRYGAHASVTEQCTQWTKPCLQYAHTFSFPL